MLGVIALIVILSVMNGLENELRDRLLSLSAHARVVVSSTVPVGESVAPEEWEKATELVLRSAWREGRGSLRRDPGAGRSRAGHAADPAPGYRSRPRSTRDGYCGLDLSGPHHRSCSRARTA